MACDDNFFLAGVFAEIFLQLDTVLYHTIHSDRRSHGWPLFLKVLPEPLSSHCTTVKCFSHGANKANGRRAGVVVHSWRKATMGSIPMAWRAGRKAARVLTVSTRAEIKM